MMVYVFALNYGKVSKFMTTTPLIYIGNLSAYTFLIHQMVIRYENILMNKTPYPLAEVPFIVNLIVTFMITIILSELCLRINKARQ